MKMSLWARYARYSSAGGWGLAPSSNITGVSRSVEIAREAARRSSASSARVELTNTLRRWSGVRMPVSSGSTPGTARPWSGTVTVLSNRSQPAMTPGTGRLRVRRRRSASGTGAGGEGGKAPPLEDASPFPLGAATPHPVVDAVDQGVLQALLLDRAGGADPPGNLDAHAVAGEERARRFVGAVATRHPLGFHRSSRYDLLPLNTEPAGIRFPTFWCVLDA